MKHTGQHNTRGHLQKLAKQRVKTRMRQNSFTERISNNWNNLQDKTVTAPATASFKSRLDKEWNNKPWKYKWDSLSFSPAN